MDRWNGTLMPAGVSRFRATVLGDNTHALHVFRSVFPELTATLTSGTFELDIPLGTKDSS
jgi:hypothetical protein